MSRERHSVLSPSASPSRRGGLLDQARAHLRAGDPGAAESCYRQILREDPHDPNALNGLGNLAVKARRYEAAVELHRHAVKAAPKDAGLLTDLANSLILAGEPQSALPHLRKALDRSPRLTPALLNLVRAYRDVDEPERALATLDKLAAASGRDGAADPVDLDLERALTLARTGQFIEAIALFRSVLKIRPTDARAIDGVATCRRATDADNDLAAVEIALADPGLAPLQRAVAHRAMGKMLDDLGRFDDAFAHFRQANDVPATPFDMRQHAALVAGSMRLFTPAFFAQRAEFGDPSEQPVFVVGLPRSGTTLVEQILASHPDVAGVGELPDIERTLREAVPQPWGSDAFFAGLRDLPAEAVRRQAKRYLSTLARRGKGRARVVDKMPHNFLVLGWIALLFPKARVIHCVRDPMDVCVSCYCQHFSEAHSYSNDLRTLGQYHRFYELLMQHWAGALPVAILDVRYEDVVRDLDQAARRMVAHLGLQWHEACLAFQHTRRVVQTPSQWQVRQPIYDSSVGRWRRYERHLGPLVDGLRCDPRRMLASGLG